MYLCAFGNYILCTHNTINHILRAFVCGKSFGKKCIANKPSKSGSGRT